MAIEGPRLPVLSFLLTPRVLLTWLTAAGLLFGVFAGGMILQVAAGLVLLAALPFFINFGFDIVERTALGYSAAPPFSWSPQTSGVRLVRLLLYLSLVTAFVRLIPASVQWVALSFALAISPAVTAFIVFHEPVYQAFNPVRIWQFVSNMGLSYITIRLVTTSLLFVGLYAVRGELDFMLTPGGLAAGALLFVLLLLMMCRLVGMLIHLRRNELGLQTHFSVEQAADDELEQRRSAIAEEVTSLSLVCRKDGFEAAWSMLEKSLKRHAWRDERLYLDALRDLTDRRLLYRLASSYIDHHMNTEVSHVWHLLKELYAESRGRFRFHAGGTLLAMTGIAQGRDERELLLGMFEAFEESYPDHPRTREALLEGAALAAIIDEDDRARALLARVDGLAGPVDVARLERVRRQIQ